METLPINSVSIRVESYKEPLVVTVDPDLDKDEMSEVFSEIIENYILDMKDKNIISNDREDLLLIDQNDFTELKNRDLSLNKKQIILGFSNIDVIKTKFDKNETMNNLNKKVLQTDYKEVEESLSKLQNEQSSLEKEVLLDIHANNIGFVPDYGNLSPRHKIKAHYARKELSGHDQDPNPKGEIEPEQKKEVAKEEEITEGGHKNNYPKLGDMYVKPMHDSPSPEILTQSFMVHKISFGWGWSKDFKNCLPPVLFTKEVWQTPLPTTMKQIMSTLVYQKNGELRLDDEEIKKAQSGVFSYVIKKALKLIFTGQGMVNMSLPVKIFEPRSTLERIADNFSFIPSYVKVASMTKDPVERIKNVVIATMIGMRCSPSVMKPFNPYLGETFEAEYPDGSKMYLEHVKHSPPISCFLLITSYGTRIHGYFIQKAKMGGNSVTLGFVGPINYTFPDGKKVSAYYPKLVQSGVVYGARLLKIVKRVCVLDKSNALKGYVEFGKKIKKGKFKSSRVDTVKGEIYTYRPEKLKDFKKDYSNLYDQFKGKYKIDTKATLEGILNETIEWDGEEYWSFENSTTCRHKPVDHPLPSDCRFREDTVWVKRKNMKQAEIWKLKLEEIQRFDRGNRKTGHKAAGRKIPKH